MARFVREQILDGTTAFRCNEKKTVSYGRVIHLWQNDVAFRQEFCDVLRDAPFTAYRWETPPVTSATADREFEFVLIDCPQLARRPDRESFADRFDAAPGGAAIAFENVGRDATLVVPCPPEGADVAGAERKSGLHRFVHLASFVREAEDGQIDAFWRLVGETMQRNLGDKPIWLSTAGMGVAWLHVRLDQRPKYYAHRPYREERS